MYRFYGRLLLFTGIQHYFPITAFYERTWILITKAGGYITHLRKLEKAATVAFMEMPMSAIAKLNTRKLLGVLSSRTLRKATIVSAFKKKPSRPSGGTEREKHEWGQNAAVNGSQRAQRCLMRCI